MKKHFKILLLIFLLVFSASSPSKSNKKKTANLKIYLTPALRYSILGKGFAMMYEPQLVSMAMAIEEELSNPRFELLDTTTSPMASIGFFQNPASVSPNVRFLGVIARVNIKLTYFPDTEAGRLSSAMDAFGKDLLRILGDTVSNIQDPSIRGAVLILIYSKAELNAPDYYQQAEAIVMFIPREVLNEFNAFRIRFNQLFAQSEIFSFKGENQIQVLLNEFLRG